MYCGSCLRDNALATELGPWPRRHRSCPLHPLTDEANVSDGHVFIETRVPQQHVPFLRKTPDTRFSLGRFGGHQAATGPA
jgi:hypothetical protein